MINKIKFDKTSNEFEIRNEKLDLGFRFSAMAQINGESVFLNECENWLVFESETVLNIKFKHKRLDIIFDFKAQVSDIGVEFELDIDSQNMIEVSFIKPVVEIDNLSCAKTFISYPFDNDAWVRCVNLPFEKARESYEIGIANGDNYSILIGTLTQNSWKTAIIPQDKRLQVVCGYASEMTRDSMPHNKIISNHINSEKIVITFGEKIEEVLKNYSTAAKIHRLPLMWNKKIPYGFNSFSAFPNNVTTQNYQDASDFFKSVDIDTQGDKSDCYINYDFDRIDFDQKAKSFEYAKGNGQSCGFYLAPFVCKEGEDRINAEICDGKLYKDVLLCDFNNNPLPSFDGLMSLDPTNPLVIKRIETIVKKHIEVGCSFVKLDFLVHGAREGNFYNKEIRTGREAYMYAMKYIYELTVQNGLFVSSSIDTLLPYGFSHSRRICCDCFGTINDSEYLLNALSHCYFLNDNLYQVNDADHIVLFESFKHNEISTIEAQTRFLASIACGSMMMFSDDYHNEEVQRRFRLLISPSEIKYLMKKHKTFVPLYIPEGEKACNVFYMNDNETNSTFCIIYNFKNESVSGKFEFMSQSENKYNQIKDIYLNSINKYDGIVEYELKAKESVVYQLTKKEKK